MICYLFVSMCGTPGLLPAVVEGAAAVGVVEVAEGEDTRPARLGPGQGAARLAREEGKIGTVQKLDGVGPVVNRPSND